MTTSIRKPTYAGTAHNKIPINKEPKKNEGHNIFEGIIKEGAEPCPWMLNLGFDKAVVKYVGPQLLEAFTTVFQICQQYAPGFRIYPHEKESTKPILASTKEEDGFPKSGGG